jgi:hypothetical protein
LTAFVLAGVVAGCASRGTSDESGRQHVDEALEHARFAHTYRVRGTFGVDGPLVTWVGFVVDTDEQYRITTHGLLIESRRVDGLHWARRLDVDGPWARVPSDEPVNLNILLSGDEIAAEHVGDQWVVTLHFDDVDVLAALTHIPSTGPTTARVTLSDGFVTDVVLRLDGDAGAHLWFWDHGADVVVHRPRSAGTTADPTASIADRCRRDSPPPPTSARSSPDAKSSTC